jgi:hypothetical protein
MGLQVLEKVIWLKLAPQKLMALSLPLVLLILLVNGLVRVKD